MGIVVVFNFSALNVRMASFGEFVGDDFDGIGVTSDPRYILAFGPQCHMLVYCIICR